jgi:AcrR family transcriptional regulator
MKPKGQDRRVQKTLKLLHEALMSLVLEKKYELIPVQEILDRANVGRSTFYSHFGDKDELLLKGIDGMRDLLRAAQAASPPVSDRSYERIIGFSQAMFTHANEYRHVYKALMHSAAGPIVRQRIQKVLVDLIKEESGKELVGRKRKRSDLPLELLIQYLASVFLLVITWWVDQKNTLSPELINDMFRSLVLPTLAANFS